MSSPTDAPPRPEYEIVTRLVHSADRRMRLVFAVPVILLLALAAPVTAAWSTLTVDSDGVVGWASSLALNSAGNPRISYYDNTNGDLNYAERSSSCVWTVTTADSGGALPDQNVLSLAANSTAGVYAGTESGVYASTDGCNTWIAVNNGLP